MSSPTPGLNPSPLTIGTTFLKQYYNVLTTTPDMIHKFYRPSSVLSHGEGNLPTDPVTLESLGESQATSLKDRFFSWAASSSDPIRFELEHGAIDAQESVGGGILLVVTGHLYLGESRKPFCHTFFLNVFSSPESKKRQYYVHNDVLRFLLEESPPMKESALAAVEEEEEENTGEDTNIAADVIATEANAGNLMIPEVQHEDQVATPNEAKMDNIADAENTAEQSKDSGGGVGRNSGGEVNKPTENLDGGGEKTTKRERKVRGHRQVRNRSQEVSKSTPSSKQTPESWASLVASGSSTTQISPSVADNPTSSTDDSPPTESPPDQESESDVQPVKTNDNKTRPQKRDPDCTIVIRNIPDGTREADVRTLFEPFANQTNARIKGITVSSHRGLAFVDYDSPTPVLAALEQRDQFRLGGRLLEVEQKTVERGRSRGGNSGRSFRDSPANNANGYRGGRTGNNQRHRSSGGRNDRGRNPRGGR